MDEKDRAALRLDMALDAMAREGSVWVREASHSMRPLIQADDELLLMPLDPARIGPGALIAYRRDGVLVLHRVIACSRDGIVMKGDALASPDPAIGWDQMVGTVVALRGPGGRRVDFDAFPWPPVNRLLGRLALLSSRLSPEVGDNGAPALRRLAWKALRVPFHLARRLVP